MNEKRTYEDLVFRGKPQDYGAYKLRKQYHLRLMVSTLAGLFLVASVYLYPILTMEEKKEPESGKIRAKARQTMNYSQLSAPPPVEVEVEQAPPVAITEIPKVKTVKFLPPVVKPDEEVAEEEIMPTQDELKKTNIGKENVEGEDSLVNYYIPSDVDIEMPTEPLPEPPKKEAPKPKKEAEIFDWTTKSAEYPGGIGEVRKWLARNIVYPEAAKSQGMEAKVVVQFVVEVDGRLSNFKVLKSGGSLFDREVMRVMRQMPAWIPGENGGKPVRSKMVVPVEFQLKR